MQLIPVIRVFSLPRRLRICDFRSMCINILIFVFPREPKESVEVMVF